jgi:hypothetical protein
VTCRRIDEIALLGGGEATEATAFRAVAVAARLGGMLDVAGRRAGWSPAATSALSDGSLLGRS